MPGSTLGRRIVLTDAALLVGLLLLAGVALLHLAELASEVSGAVDEYEEARIVSRATLDVQRAGSHVRSPEIAVDPRDAIDAALAELAEFRRYQGTEDAAEGHQAQESDAERRATAALRAARARLDDGDAPAAEDRLEAALLALDDLEAETDVTGMRALADRLLRRAIVLIGAWSAAIMVAGCLASWVGHRSVVRPLAELGDAVRAVAAGRFRTRVPVTGPREIGELALAFNGMADELDRLYRGLEEEVRRTSRELARAERLASVGFLAAGVAHEINTPLLVISGNAELALRRSAAQEDPAIGEALTTIRDEAFRCKGITDGLLSLARSDPPEPTEQVALDVVARDVVELLAAHPAFAERRVSVDPVGGDGARVRARAAELKQVALNLVVNALQATQRNGGAVRLRVERGEKRHRLMVEDDGRGMSAEELEHVFEPFYTRRHGEGDRNGTGLGLSIAQAIVAAHDGALVAESPGPGRGSRFTLSLPAAEVAP